MLRAHGRISTIVRRSASHALLDAPRPILNVRRVAVFESQPPKPQLKNQRINQKREAPLRPLHKFVLSIRALYSQAG
ncbi:hypothetical protein CVE34_16520 [Pseudomonas syringae pv. actinidiae]|nr:hypothetical protein [Pseudomonas syringae pv. actinidiae]NAS70660.1 hypothetical protein [Pseudomonas syringae pv. actinidiae]NAS76555.1 hypothetical protein [Pseudomonas syringae pv. actinidiae]NAS90681.1 hypothetical protein [Pseudomonas syringae pv. actinidiae]NAT00573.1 hypothetical protein [Pseudomonas syringae pv. actinidiae]